MKYQTILITGGAGFVGSSLAFKFKQHYSSAKIICLDNLKRRGSELNVPKLQASGIEFIHGDVRNKEDLVFKTKIDLLIECSAEPSVLAGINESPEYLINTNLLGAVNCLELAKKNKSDFIFLSTSRVYPVEYLEKLKFEETPTRFVLSKNQSLTGASKRGINEDFPLDKPRSLYGGTKLAAEILIQEYAQTYSTGSIINRCGVITGPGQFGKVDQGVVVLWLAKHYFKQSLTYLGYGGLGKQVRDLLHVDDLFEALKIQIEDFKRFNGQVFNLGGGEANTVSLLELTALCQQITGNKVEIKQVEKQRPNDIRIFITDYSKFNRLTQWQPKKDVLTTLQEIYDWIKKNQGQLSQILS
ncbi:MAG: NAD-dependent epimerase/dehydratase family protein [Patescibacteria group bacterium]